MCMPISRLQKVYEVFLMVNLTLGIFACKAFGISSHRMPLIFGWSVVDLRKESTSQATHVRALYRGGATLHVKRKIEQRNGPRLETPPDTAPVPSHRQDPVEVSTGVAELVFANGDPAFAAEPTNKAKKYIDQVSPSVFVKVVTSFTFMQVIGGRGTSQISSKP